MWEVSLKVLCICLSDTDIGIDFMIPILSDTFNTVYSPNHGTYQLPKWINMTVAQYMYEHVIKGNG